MVTKVNQPRAETLVLKQFVTRELCFEEVTLVGTGTARTLEVGQVLAEYTSGANLGNHAEAAVGGIEGTDTAVAVLTANVDVPAAGTVKSVAVRRLAIVDRAELIFAGTPTAPQQQTFIDQLAVAHLLAR